MNKRIDQGVLNVIAYIKWQLSQGTTAAESMAFLAILNQDIAELLEHCAMKIAVDLAKSVPETEGKQP
jgi:hypothetical protein